MNSYFCIYLIKKLGNLLKEKRLQNNALSLNTFAYGYDLNPGNISRIENGQIEPKFTMLWRIAEALNLPLSGIIRELEEELGENFYINEK